MSLLLFQDPAANKRLHNKEILDGNILHKYIPKAVIHLLPAGVQLLSCIIFRKSFVSHSSNLPQSYNSGHIRNVFISITVLLHLSRVALLSSHHWSRAEPAPNPGSWTIYNAMLRTGVVTTIEGREHMQGNSLISENLHNRNINERNLNIKYLSRWSKHPTCQ